MKVYSCEAEFDGDRSVVALGTFDGVHIGHQALISRALAIARETGAECVVSTFDRHPLSVLCPERAPKQLLTIAEKVEKLARLGVDGVVLAPFSKEFAAVDAERYLRGLVRRMRPVALVAGFNYTFGAGGRGDAALIRRMAAELSYRAEIVPAVRDGDENVSSTLIRRLIAEGDTARAERLLRIAPDSTI